ELDVPVGKSVTLLGKWTLGSMYFIEPYHDTASVPKDAVIQWWDDGAVLCLRPQSPPLTSKADGWAEAGKKYSSTFNGIWQITPETMIKVVSWKKDAQTEAQTIKFINKNHPEIPTTQIIYDWVDHAWTRSFMIMKRAGGVLMDEAMIYMSDDQVQDVADQVAVHIKTLTQHTSNMLETVDHFGLTETRLVGWKPLDEAAIAPSCYRRQWPRFTPEEFEAHLKEASNMTSIPNSGPEFVLYNSDITTHNLFVSAPRPGATSQLVQMIDWEYTAYWPRYWVATCASPDGPFVLNRGGKLDIRWPVCLNKALVKAGFESKLEWWNSFDDESDSLRDERAGKVYKDYMAAIREENLRLENESKVTS
ncbi:hypothetical protein MMC17_005770, partial [Xylographa soralifera]|nr:hypothetical protein [Xylographa soralifera]